MTDLPKLRRSELNARLTGIEKELDHWKQQTEPGAPYERHWSQVQRLSLVVGSPIDAMKRQLADLVDDGELLAQAEELEKNVLALHSIWEVFREKLLLREDGLFKAVLPAFDDLAWACYRPAMERFAKERKEPPLLYFTTLWSPFAQGRDTSFQNEVHASGGALIREEFLDILHSLPVPLIGLPWYHSAHIPGAIVIAHEVGHIVERDFGLTAAIQDALKAADLDQPAAWSAWATEVFADVYGCLGMGPAFVGSMLDLLASGLADVQQERPNPKGKYPMRIMRVSLMLEVLRAIALGEEAQRLEATWQATYGPLLIPQGYGDDIARVVQALLAGPYPAKDGTDITLLDVLRFPQELLPEARQIAEDAAKGTEIMPRRCKDPRCCFAAARYLHEDPSIEPLADGAFERIVQAIVTKEEGESRMRGPIIRGASPGPAQPTANKLSPELEEADRTLGRLLFQSIVKGGATSPTPVL